MLIGVSSSTLCEYVVGEYTGKLWEVVSSQEASKNVNYRTGKRGLGDYEWGREMRARSYHRRWIDITGTVI